MPVPERENPRVLALIAAFNEADIIGQVVGALIEEGVEVYLLDHSSSDGTAAAAARFLGRGLLRIERFPEDSGFTPAEVAAHPWECILRRKQQLAGELDAHWFIHHDADEFRESLWPDLPLVEAIGLVDREGYNAIDFEVLDFPPVRDGLSPGDDVRQAFPYYERSRLWNKVQIRCWKKQPGAVDLVSSGGHEVVFHGRRVFPFRFLVRHYPIRSQAHGERKVGQERRPRLVAAERERGWHRQYDDIGDGHRFVRDPAGLTRFDPRGIRLELLLRSRLSEELEASAETRQLADESLRRERDLLGHELDGRHREVERLHADLDARNRQLEEKRSELEKIRSELAGMRSELAGVRSQLEGARSELEGARSELDARNHDVARAEGEVAALRLELAGIRRSLSWRLTAPLRAGLRRLRGY